jgi:hypothetical protein
VRIALRPLDLEEALASADGASDGEEEDEDGETDDEEETACVTVGQCIAENQDRYDQYVASPLGAGVARAVAPIRDQCFSDYAGLLPFPVQGCE